MSLLHRQISRSQVPALLLPLWKSKNSLAFDLSWSCWLYCMNKGPCPDYTGLNLSGRDLRRAFLWEANLRETNFQEANLQGADLWGANLSQANLQGANLSGANFYRAYRPSDPPRGWKIVNNYLQKE